jgi:hypothetical protein
MNYPKRIGVFLGTLFPVNQGRGTNSALELLARYASGIREVGVAHLHSTENRNPLHGRNRWLRMTSVGERGREPHTVDRFRNQRAVLQLGKEIGEPLGCLPKTDKCETPGFGICDTVSETSFGYGPTSQPLDDDRDDEFRRFLYAHVTNKSSLKGMNLSIGGTCA